MGLGSKSAKAAPALVEESIWPSINSLVWVRLPCCDSAIHPSRVEDLADGNLVLAAPSRPHQELVPAPEESENFLVGWRHGVACKTVRVAFQVSEDGDVPTWTVRAVAPPEVVQRRRYVRAAWDQDINCVIPVLGVQSGRILDISEGGVRCALPETAREPGNPYFQVEFEMGGTPLKLDVEVAWWGAPRDGSVTVGLSFIVEDQSLSDRLRAHTFALQLEERRRF